MSKKADARDRRFMDEAIANFHTPPLKTHRPGDGYVRPILAPRVESRDRLQPNRPGTRKVSKLSRRATPFGTTVKDRKALAK